VGLIVAVNKKIGFITVDSNGVIAFFRLNPVQLIGYSAAELRNTDINAFPFWQEFITGFLGKFLIQKAHSRAHGDSLLIGQKRFTWSGK